MLIVSEWSKTKRTVKEPREKPRTPGTKEWYEDHDYDDQRYSDDGNPHHGELNERP